MVKNQNDIITEYCQKCTLYGKEFHYLSSKLHDCIQCYHHLSNGMELVDMVEKYRRR